MPVELPQSFQRHKFRMAIVEPDVHRARQPPARRPGIWGASRAAAMPRNAKYVHAIISSARIAVVKIERGIVACMGDWKQSDAVTNHRSRRSLLDPSFGEKRPRPARRIEQIGFAFPYSERWPAIYRIAPRSGVSIKSAVWDVSNSYHLPALRTIPITVVPESSS